MGPHRFLDCWALVNSSLGQVVFKLKLLLGFNRYLTLWCTIKVPAPIRTHKGGAPRVRRGEPTKYCDPNSILHQLPTHAELHNLRIFLAPISLFLK